MLIAVFAQFHGSEHYDSEPSGVNYVKQSSNNISLLLLNPVTGTNLHPLWSRKYHPWPFEYHERWYCNGRHWRKENSRDHGGYEVPIAHLYL